MNVSVPAIAPPVPPETGASIKSIPAASAALATFWLVAAAMVELSITRVSLAIAASRPGAPSLPRNSASTCWLAGNMLTTTFAPCTASCALNAAVAPSATSLLTASLDRSNTRTSCPAFFRLMAMGPPILPKPMNAIVVMCCLLGVVVISVLIAISACCICARWVSL